VNRLVEVVVVIAFSGLIANIAASVFFRYVLNDSLVWAEELARYLFIWVVFLAAGLGVGRNIHIGLDILPGLLPPAWQQPLLVAINIGIGVFLVVLIVAGAQFAAFGMRASAMLLGVPMIYVYAAVPVGAALMLLNLLPGTLRLLMRDGQDRSS
jgi:TRAP-type C4-dicarboxylate transport system permease small subunit